MRSHKVRVDGSDPLKSHRATGLKVETARQHLPRRLAYVHFARYSRFLKAAGDVDRVTPHVVSKLLGSDDSTSGRTGMDANTQRHVGQVGGKSLGNPQHRQAEIDDLVGMALKRLRKTAGDHIGIPDRLDLHERALGD
jgi:hypothetical protein